MKVKTPTGWLKGLKARLLKSRRSAEAKRTDAQDDLFLKYSPGTKFCIFLHPRLPAPFAALLDFDALAREAGEARQAATRRRQEPRTPKGLRALLKPGVTRTEELILTAELSRIGSCLVARPVRRGRDRRSSAQEAFCLSLTDEGGVCVTYAWRDYSISARGLADAPRGGGAKETT